jgi:hypothetical protein
MPEVLKVVGAIVALLITGALTLWWLIVVAQRLGMEPKVVDGNVVLDEFQRAKDILLVCFPCSQRHSLTGVEVREHAKQKRRHRAPSSSSMRCSTQDLRVS